MKELEKTMLDIAGFMAVAARTAPKAKGLDNIVMKIFENKDLDALADKMIETGKDTARPQTFERDARSVRSSDCMLVVGTKRKVLGLDCGFCGLGTCDQANTANVVCAYNSGDLGIAVGSAVTAAGRFHADNRIMYTVGYTVIKNSLMDDDICMALGIPLSATGKNPFFDRK